MLLGLSLRQENKKLLTRERYSHALTFISCWEAGWISVPSLRATCEMNRPAPARVLSPTPRLTSAARRGVSATREAESTYLQR